MNDEPISGGPSAAIGKAGSDEVSSGAMGPVLATADDKIRWRQRWKTRVDRLLPRHPPGPEDRLTSPLPGVVLFMAFLGLAVLSILLIQPPSPLPANAPADRFSAARAMAHVEAVAARPHPIGTTAHAEVQTYLFGQLRALGLQPQVQQVEVLQGQIVTHVENVLARLPGSKGGGKAILLSAHYDTMTAGPGAADDTSGVATLLETARALKATGRPLANDVILFFSDGEEQGLMGSTAFVREHPWAKDVGLTITVDSGARTGRVLCQNTSEDDGWLIANYAKAAPDSLASSLAPVFGERGDDSYTFEDAGYPTLGFGAVGDNSSYHTVLDDPAHLDTGMLQDAGTTTLALVRRFGSLDLTRHPRGDAIFFSPFGASHIIIHYPRGWAFPLVILAGAAWGAALAFGMRWKQVSPRGVLLGVLASLALVAILAGVGTLLWRLAVALYPQYDPLRFGWGATTYNGRFYWLASVALGIGIAALLYVGVRARVRAAELELGFLTLWLVLAVGAATALPGASYLAMWPLLFGSLGALGWFALRRHGSETLWSIALLGLSAIPVLVLLTPVIYLLYVSMTSPDVWIPMALMGLLVGLLTPHLSIMTRPRRWWLPTLMGVVAVGALVGGHLTSTHTPERPLQDGVVYALDGDGRKAYWLNWSGLDPWTDQFIDESDSGGTFDEFFYDALPAAYKVSAPLVDLAAPTVEAVDTQTPGVFRLHVTPASGTWTTHLIVLPWKTPVAYYLNGKRIVAKDGWMLYWDPPAEGYDVAVKTRKLDVLKLRVVQHTLGLPAIPDVTYVDRPAWIIPTAESGENSTWVAKSFTFGR